MKTLNDFKKPHTVPAYTLYTLKRGNAFLRFLFFSILMQLLCTITSNAQVTDSSRMQGVEVKIFHSKILGEDRRIYIQMPAKIKRYEKYPVLYLLDGEAHTQMAGGQVQYLSEAYKIIPSLIIVGIENTDRTRDLTPTHSIIGPDGKPDTSSNAFGKSSGGGENFLQFIKQELMPYIEGNYPTAPYKILSGHSLGGLMALYSLVHHPDFFNAYIAISPSLQWDNEVMLRQVAEKLDPKKISSIILFFSDANEDAAFHENQLKLDSILKKKNIPGLKYKRLFYPEESHASEPVKAFYDAIRLIYPQWHLPYNNSAFKKTMNSDIIKNHFKELSKSYGYAVIPSHDDINAIGRFLRNDPNRVKDAIELFEMNATNYPASAQVQELLGDTYLKVNDNKKAMAAYEKALLLEPKNEKLQEKLKSIVNKK
jgi:predicted alpha/beta superfamily hydrolase